MRSDAENTRNRTPGLGGHRWAWRPFASPLDDSSSRDLGRPAPLPLWSRRLRPCSTRSRPDGGSQLERNRDDPIGARSPAVASSGLRARRCDPGVERSRHSGAGGRCSSCPIRRSGGLRAGLVDRDRRQHGGDLGVCRAPDGDESERALAADRGCLPALSCALSGCAEHAWSRDRGPVRVTARSGICLDLGHRRHNIQPLAAGKARRQQSPSTTLSYGTEGRVTFGRRPPGDRPRTHRAPPERLLGWSSGRPGRPRMSFSATGEGGRCVPAPSDRPG